MGDVGRAAYLLGEADPAARQQILNVSLRRSSDGVVVHFEPLSGIYKRCGENHGRPLYKRTAAQGHPAVYIYYWDADANVFFTHGRIAGAHGGSATPWVANRSGLGVEILGR